MSGFTRASEVNHRAARSRLRLLVVLLPPVQVAQVPGALI
jgi:hypothetical protein